MPRSLKEYIEHFPKTALNLGCGRNNPPDFYGLDIMQLDGVDLVADVNSGIPLPDNTFNYVYARDFLEHIDAKNNIKLMEEIYRILKPGGKLEFIVPSTDGNNTAAFQDPTHYSFWNEMKFNYFLKDEHAGLVGKNLNTLLFFGRITKYKGLDVLLKAYKNLKETKYKDLKSINGELI